MSDLEKSKHCLMQEVSRLRQRVKGLHEMMSAEYNIVVRQVATIVAENFIFPDPDGFLGSWDHAAQIETDLRREIQATLRDLCVTKSDSLHMVLSIMVCVIELRDSDLGRILRS